MVLSEKDFGAGYHPEPQGSENLADAVRPK
jgi:hypothetical protein